MSAGESVTCPSCGSLVPVGDRKCDNCGARQKDFAPAPASYTRPETVETPRPPAPAPAPPAVSSPAPAPAPAPTAAVPTPAAPAVPSSPPALPYAPGSHAQGLAPRSNAYAAPGAAYAAPTVYKAGAGANAPVRSRAASLALVFAAIPLAVNLVGFILLAVLGAVANGSTADDIEALATIGVFSAVYGVIGAIVNLVLFILALVFGIRGVLQTAGRAATGRWRAVLALVIVAWHLLLLLGFIALAVAATN